MSNRAWMPLHVNDYLAKTLDLSTLEHGALLLLLVRYRRNGERPADDEITRRWTKLTPTQWTESKHRLLSFFAADEGQYSAADRLCGVGARRRAPLAMRHAVLERDGEVCAYCGSTAGPFHVDHKTPWSLGGKHDLDNLCVACEPCNLAKSDLPYAVWMEIIQ